MRSFLVAFVVLLLAVPSFGQDDTNAQQTTWGSIKALYGADGLPKTINSSKIEEPTFPAAEPPWTNPLAQEAIAKFGLKPDDILAVQHVVALRNEVPLGSTDVVVTNAQWYYASPGSGTVSDRPPWNPEDLTEMDVYGSGVQLVVDAWNCFQDEWVVTFYLPVCFYEISAGRFDGILDAWANTPYCNWGCNGGPCAGFQCGPAWNWNQPGYTGWWNFRDCNTQASGKVGKQIQKRWLYTWRSCYGYSDAVIAGFIHARIRF